MDVASRNSECVNSTDIFGRKCSARVVRIINGYFGSFEYFQIVLVLSNTRGQCQRLVEFDSVAIETCNYLDYEGKSCSLLTQLITHTHFESHQYIYPCFLCVILELYRVL